MFKNRVIWRFLGAYVLLILLAVFVLNFFVSLKLRDYYEEKISERLLSNSLLISEIISKPFTEKNQPLIQYEAKRLADEINARITIIDRTGKVLGDSEKNPLTMENHSLRIEICKALEHGVGESTRFSDTLNYNMKYLAKAIKKDSETLGFTRLALPLDEVDAQIQVIYRIVLMGGITACIMAIIIGYFISKKITQPISEMKDIAKRISGGDFTKKISPKSRDELGSLAESLNTMSDQLESKIENLKKMDKMRTDFIANVSHELKTPLTSIRGFIETLEDGAMDDKETAEKFISIIRKRAEALDSIIKDLLSLSEMELSTEMLEKNKFDLKELIDEVMLSFGHAFKLKNMQTKTDAFGESFLIEADKIKIEQVLVNIIDNAVKYSDEKGEISIVLREKEKDLEVTIKDNGPGIPEKDLPRIFERFYRVDKARSRELGGTGLGLAIVKHTILLHRGSININNADPKGIKVTIILPKKLLKA